jgi:crotonobetainyl-CoA:carnitine CoA-transferase CaiB-like acyl-CoA transferase
MPQPDLFWPNFARLMGHPEWADDARYKVQEQRRAHSKALVAQIDVVTRQRTLAEWGPLLDEAGVIWAPVQRITDVVDDPQTRATERFIEIDHPEIGAFPTIAAPFRLSSGSPRPRKAAPRLDRETAAILAEYGFSEAERTALQTAGVIGK